MFNIPFCLRLYDFLTMASSTDPRAVDSPARKHVSFDKKLEMRTWSAPVTTEDKGGLKYRHLARGKKFEISPVGQGSLSLDTGECNAYISEKVDEIMRIRCGKKGDKTHEGLTPLEIAATLKHKYGKNLDEKWKIRQPPNSAGNPNAEEYLSLLDEVRRCLHFGCMGGGGKFKKLDDSEQARYTVKADHRF